MNFISWRDILLDSLQNKIKAEERKVKYHFNIPSEQLIDTAMIHKFVQLINSTALAVSVI